eukprot:COSAG04_NODE_1203_length_7755_cov_2.975836_2_plen_35_part_00
MVVSPVASVSTTPVNLQPCSLAQRCSLLQKGLAV